MLLMLLIWEKVQLYVDKYDWKWNGTKMEVVR